MIEAAFGIRVGMASERMIPFPSRQPDTLILPVAIVLCRIDS